MTTPIEPASDERIIAGIKAIGEWCVPYIAPRESGVALDGDITQAHADQINAECIERYRPFLEDALEAVGARINELTLENADLCKSSNEWADRALAAEERVKTLEATLQWVRKNYAGGSTKGINARIDAVLQVQS